MNFKIYHTYLMMCVYIVCLFASSKHNLKLNILIFKMKPIDKVREFSYLRLWYVTIDGARKQKPLLKENAD